MAWFHFAPWTLWKQTVMLGRANHSNCSEKPHNYSKECNTNPAWLVFKVILITLHGCLGTVPHVSCQGFWPGAEASAMVPEESFLAPKYVALADQALSGFMQNVREQFEFSLSISAKLLSQSCLAPPPGARSRMLLRKVIRSLTGATSIALSDNILDAFA